MQPEGLIRAYGHMVMLLILKQLLKDMCYHTTKVKILFFNWQKAYMMKPWWLDPTTGESVTVVCSWAWSCLARIIQIQIQIQKHKGPELIIYYWNTNTEHRYLFDKDYTNKYSSGTQIQNTGTCLARIIQIQINTGLELNSYHSDTNTESTLAEACQY